MKLLRLEALPDGFEGYTSDSFGEYEESKLHESGADVIAYWYAYGCYSGVGHILARKNGRWYHHDCGHCSCYGPTDVDFSGEGDESLDTLLSRCTAELRSYLDPLAELIRANL